MNGSTRFPLREDIVPERPWVNCGSNCDVLNVAAQPDDHVEPARPWRISTGGCESWVPARHPASFQPAEGASLLREETPVVE